MSSKLLSYREFKDQRANSVLDPYAAIYYDTPHIDLRCSQIQLLLINLLNLSINFAVSVWHFLRISEKKSSQLHLIKNAIFSKLLSTCTYISLIKIYYTRFSIAVFHFHRGFSLGKDFRKKFIIIALDKKRYIF